MKRTIASIVLAGTIAAGSLGFGTTAAQAAGNPGCITRTEFSRIHNGMTATQVKRIVGSLGRVALSSPPIVVRDFTTCTRFHVSNVSFWSGRVQSKLYI